MKPLKRGQGFNPATREVTPHAASGWDKDPHPWNLSPKITPVSAIRNARRMKARDLWRRKNYG